MGQYFSVVNLDKKEYLTPAHCKIWELCANNDIRMLGYLLATNNADGTALIKYFNDPLKAMEQHGKDFKILCLENGTGYGEVNTEYFGRWCKDRIAIVGDYASESTNYTIGQDGPSYGELYENPEWDDITENAEAEFNRFIEADHLKIGNSGSIRPDIALSGEKVYHNPKITEFATAGE